MTIIWSEKAIDRLAEIHNYIAQDSPNRASEFIRELFGSVELLRAFPLIGRIVPEYKRVEIREIIHSNYRILYHSLDDRIEIVNILHRRQLL